MSNIRVTQDITKKSSDLTLSRYIKDVNSIPSLDKKTELELADKFITTGNIEIANVLVKSHLKLVVKIAFSYKNYGISMMDIIAEGNLGLMHAIKKFDPKEGFRISTYATWWIKAYIQDFILKSWSLVKIGTTALQKRIFFNLSKIKKKLGIPVNKLLTNKQAEKAAEYLGGTSDDLIEMDTRMSNSDVSLNKLISNDEDSSELIDTIASNQPNPEEIVIFESDENKKRKIFKEALSLLDEREMDIFARRNIAEKKATLDELSREFFVSKERIRQIEEKCIQKIKDYVLKHYSS